MYVCCESFECMYTYTHLCTYVYLCMYICMYIFMHVYMYVYIYRYINIHVCKWCESACSHIHTQARTHTHKHIYPHMHAYIQLHNHKFMRIRVYTLLHRRSARAHSQRTLQTLPWQRLHQVRLAPLFVSFFMSHLFVSLSTV